MDTETIHNGQLQAQITKFEGLTVSMEARNIDCAFLPGKLDSIFGWVRPPWKQNLVSGVKVGLGTILTQSDTLPLTLKKDSLWGKKVGLKKFWLSQTPLEMEVSLLSNSWAWLILAWLDPPLPRNKTQVSEAKVGLIKSSAQSDPLPETGPGLWSKSWTSNNFAWSDTLHQRQEGYRLNRLNHPGEFL